MSTTITISLSDADFERLRSAAAQSHQTPEELAAAAIAERYGDDAILAGAIEEARQGRDPLVYIMRARGHLVDPKSYPPPPYDEDLPPYGSEEYKRFLEEIGQELSDAVEQTGKSLADLIERR